MRATVKNSISAIIVTFFPDDRFFEMLRSIDEQVDNIWIVDNGSSGQTRSKVENLGSNPNNSFNFISAIIFSP